MQARSASSELRDALPLAPYRKSGAALVVLSLTALAISSHAWVFCGYDCNYFPNSNRPTALEASLIALAVLFASFAYLLFTTLRLFVLKRNHDELRSAQGLNVLAVDPPKKLASDHWAILSVLALVVGKYPLPAFGVALSPSECIT